MNYIQSRFLETSDGYDFATEIEKEVNELLSRHPVNEQNALAYMTMARTLITGLDQIYQIAANSILHKVKKLEDKN